MLVCDIHAQGRSKIMATVRRLRSLAKRPTVETVEPRRLVPIQARFAGCSCEYVRLVGVAAQVQAAVMESPLSRPTMVPVKLGLAVP